MSTRVAHIARISVQDWRTSKVRARSATSGDPLLRTVYFEILMALYEHGGTLPADPDDLSDILMLPAEDIAERLPILEKLGQRGRGGIIISEGALTNRRVTEDLEDGQAYKRSQSEFGKRGGRPTKAVSPSSEPSGSASGAPSEPKAPKNAPLQATENKDEKRVPLGSQKGTQSLPIPKPLPKPLPSPKPLPLPVPLPDPDPPSSGGGISPRKRPPRQPGLIVAPRHGEEAGKLAAAARRSFINEIERAWKKSRGDRPTPPLGADAHALLEAYASEGVPVEVIIGKVLELESRQSTRAKPIGAFSYFTQTGALEEAVQAWREGDVDDADPESLEEYRSWRLGQLRGYAAGECPTIWGGKPSRDIAERAIREIESASGWPQIQAVLQAVLYQAQERHARAKT